MKNKIIKDDEVIVIAGKDKNKRGKVIKVIHCKNDRVRLVVEGVNMVKKHVKPNPQANQPGGIIEKEAPIEISNVMLYNSATKKGDRVGIKILEDGKKVRCFRSSGEIIDVNKG